MKLRTLLFLSSLLIHPLQANTDVRTWSIGEKTFSAELVSYDPETDIVTFRSKGKEFERKGEELSLVDRAWLNEWVFLGEQLEEQLEEFGGKLEHFLTEGDYPTDLFIYHPPGVEKPEERPLLIMFHPGGKAQRYLLKFIETAAELKAVVVTCGTFRNTGDDNEGKEKELLARFKEMLPQLEEQVKHDPKQVVMGGSSGGAWRAFHYAAWVDRPWKGIFSNGGWLGGPKYWDLDYPAMRVSVVNGHLDRAANSSVKRYGKILEAKGCVLGAITFQGGHQAAPSEHTTEAIRWILKEPEEEMEEQVEE